MTTQDQPPALASRRKVLLVDDHPLVRMGLTNIINQEPDLAVCGETDGENNVLQMVRELQPDIAVVDWSLKDKDATGLIATFRQHLPQMPVLVLSMHEELFYAERALRAGASGYIMKQEATDKIIEAIHSVIAGHAYLSGRMAHVANLDIREWLAEHRPAQPLPTSAAQLDGAGEPAIPADAQRNTTLHLSIVIPVYNSEATIGRLCDQLMLELSPFYHLQLILVDDNSSDHSATVCQKIYELYPEQVDCITLSRNFGEHNAVMAGLNCADGDYCVIMDDDFQNPPSEVRKLVAEALKGHDVVYVRYETKRHSPYRNLGSRLHNWMATRALGKPADLFL
ncbi:MAG: glycosyltransferase, partial [Kiritimatiellaeota bacterium]|nr:glycosyltransferase [Kiritimatiellota bacterium]